MPTNDIDWGEYAVAYDFLNTLIPYTDLLEEVSGYIPHQTSHLLDAGCGTGNLIKVIEMHHPHIVIHGVDENAQMRSCAVLKTRANSLIEILPADLNQQPLFFKDDTYSAVTSTNAIYMLREPQEVIREFYRVLKPGGRLILVTPKYGVSIGRILKAHCRSSKPNEYWDRFYQSSEIQKELLAEAFSNTPDVPVDALQIVLGTNKNIVENRNMHFYTELELRSILKNAGFNIILLSLTYADQAWLVVAEK